MGLCATCEFSYKYNYDALKEGEYNCRCKRTVYPIKDKEECKRYLFDKTKIF